MYNQGLPMGYNSMAMQQNYQYPYPQQLQNLQQLNQQQAPQINNAANSQQIQNGGFVSVRSIDEARKWAVAPGNSVTFKIEGMPYVCEKTMGFSQLESPRFEIFKLVKEDYDQERCENAAQPKEDNSGKSNIMSDFVLAEDFNVLSKKVADLETEMEELRHNASEKNAKSNYNSNAKGNYKKSEVKKNE